MERKKILQVGVRQKQYKVLLHGDHEAGGYWVECPKLPGCLSQGETVEEALTMIRDAIRGHLAVLEKEPSWHKAV